MSLGSGPEKPFTHDRKRDLVQFGALRRELSENLDDFGMHPRFFCVVLLRIHRNFVQRIKLKPEGNPNEWGSFIFVQQAVKKWVWREIAAGLFGRCAPM